MMTSHCLLGENVQIMQRRHCFIIDFKMNLTLSNCYFRDRPSILVLKCFLLFSFYVQLFLLLSDFQQTRWHLNLGSLNISKTPKPFLSHFPTIYFIPMLTNCFITDWFKPEGRNNLNRFIMFTVRPKEMSI